METKDGKNMLKSKNASLECKMNVLNNSACPLKHVTTSLPTKTGSWKDHVECGQHIVCKPKSNVC